MNTAPTPIRPPTGAPAGTAPDTPGETQLWILAEEDVDRVAERIDAHASLSTDELARLGRLVRPGSQRRHIGARLLTRWALARHTGSTPAQVDFAQSCFGRPLLAGPGPQVDFNLTHTDGLIALAITARGRIGLDAERYPARATALSLISTVLTPRERADLTALPEPGHAGALAERWVLKEAYTKALGLGLHRRFDSFDVRGDARGGLGVFDPHAADDPLPDWELRLLRCGTDHVLALALNRTNSLPDKRILGREQDALLGRLDVIDAARMLAGIEGVTADALPQPHALSVAA